MIVTPTILESEQKGFILQLTKLSPFFPRFQIDFQDGIFIQNKTVTADQAVSVLTENKQLFNRLVFDFDIMAKDYGNYIKKLNALSMIFDINTVLLPYSLLPNLEELRVDYPQFSFGLSLRPQDSTEELMKNYELESVDSLQIMSVELGPQGQSFQPKMLQKIEQLRLNNYRKNIFIDGGINDQSIPDILAAKYQPDILVIGSFLTKTDDLKKHIDFLKPMMTI